MGYGIGGGGVEGGWELLTGKGEGRDNVFKPHSSPSFLLIPALKRILSSDADFFSEKHDNSFLFFAG